MTHDTQTDLQTIIAAKRQLLQQRQERVPMPAVLALAEMQVHPRPLLNIVTDGSEVILIGQILLAETYDPVAAALAHVRDGVNAVSLFTDDRVYSKGMEDLLLVARGLRSTAVINQNYTLNEYHVTETRAAGASAIVAYSAALKRDDLRKIVSLAHRWKMTTIVQVSDEEEMAYAASLSPHVIGVGNGTALFFDPTHDIALLKQLMPMKPFYSRMMPLGCLRHLEDVAAVVDLGVDAVICDTTLIAPRDTSEQLRALLERDPTW